VLLDLNGTLLDPTPLVPEGAPDRERAALAVLEAAVMQSMALTLAGGHRPFADLLAAARAVAGHPGPAPAPLPPFPDLRTGLDALREAGLRPAVVTNSSAGPARAALAAAGVADRVDAVVGADALGAFKPSDRVYRGALGALGARADDCWMVAAHWWDLLGAAAVGLRTGLVRRPGWTAPGWWPGPDAAADDLPGVAAAIAQAPPSRT
jgi:2-haloacid dehalogenase